MSTNGWPAWPVHAVSDAQTSRVPTYVAVIDGRHNPDDATFVVIQGFRSWLEPFELQRFDVIARILHARLVIVELPGFGGRGSRLRSAERRALLRGEFGPVAARMFDAVRRHLGPADRNVSLSFLGYSMGASVATAMANVAARQRYNVDYLVLVEPVALRRWSIRGLINATIRENRWIEDYIAQNGQFAGAIAPWESRQGVRPAANRRLDLLLLGGALRHGRLRTELVERQLYPRTIVLVHGDRSALSAGIPPAVVAALHERSVRVEELVVAGHHALWHSLPAVDEMSRQLAVILQQNA